MKTRESGMPDEAMWQGFFDPAATLQRLGLRANIGDVADLGCGYGTFTIPAAGLTGGIVHAIDIEPAMVEATLAKAAAAGLANVRAICRDFVESGTGLPDDSVGYVMLFNILHCERPSALLAEAWRVLARGGTLAVMHWNYDPATPRGPSMAIRPRPEQCRAWALRVGFEPTGSELIDLPPYHYGLTFRKPRQDSREE